MEFIKENLFAVVLLVAIIGYLLKRLMNRDGERGYISSLLYFGIKSIDLEADNESLLLINDYLSDEYKIKGIGKEYHEAFNLVVRFILNDYFSNERTAKGKELKDSHVYIMTRIYTYCSKLTNSYGSSKNTDFYHLSEDRYDRVKNLNETGIDLMKMYLASLNYINQKKINLDINGLSEERIKEIIKEKRIELFN